MPAIVLMENASRGLALQALRMLGFPDHPPGANVLIVCGGGNNGGDGLAAARHLHNAGAGCTIALTRPADRYTGDAATNLHIVQAMDLQIVDAADDPAGTLAGLPPADLVLDGLLGTGLDRDVQPPLDAVIEFINRQPAPVLAIDIPSGLDCDTGRPRPAAVRAAATVTFVGAKQGFLEPGAGAYTGQVIVTDIGVPRELVAALGRPAPSQGKRGTGVEGSGSML